MATYVNDLRLKEIATGDEDGTWGTSTNTNLELIGEAFSFGTEAITTNADTHTTTIADGSTDPGRSMFLAYTGTLDSACTITIAPNTVSKLWFIENATSGSQNIIIKQGSGATITIPPGDTKAIYSDGAGSGGKMVDAFASLSVVDLKVQDDLTVTDAALVTGVLTTTATQVATGGITSGSDILSDTDSTDSLGSTGVRWLKGWFDSLQAGTLVVGAGSITDTSGAITFGNENLVTTGTLGSGAFTASTIAGTTGTLSGILSVDDVTDSTSGTTGSIHTDGGLGVAKALWVGTTATAATGAFTSLNSTRLTGGIQALGSISGSNAIDVAAGDTVTATITGATAFTVSNLISGVANTITMHLTNAGAGAITWPSGTVFNLTGSPTLPSSGTTVIILETYDNGTSYAGIQAWRSGD